MMAKFLARERRAQVILREGACSLIPTSQPASWTLTEVTIRLKERVCGSRMRFGRCWIYISTNNIARDISLNHEDRIRAELSVR